MAADLTGRERVVPEDEFLVSKTDTGGRIKYTNRTFLTVSLFTEADLIGQPHSVIRHPDMPKCIFKVFWDHLQTGDEVFAYIINRCKNGDHYWVAAHATPSLDHNGRIVGYHSARRRPDRDIVQSTIVPLYQELRDLESRHGGGRKGMRAAESHLMDILAQKGITYNAWFFSL